jgi:hypothetical protein
MNDTPEKPNTEPSPSEGSLAMPRPPSPTLRGFIGGLVGGAAIALVAVGGLTAAWPDLQAWLLSDHNRRIESLDRAIDEMNPRLVALEREQAQAVGGGARTDAATSLAQRVATLENQVRALSASSPSADIARLSAELQTLRAAIPAEGTILRLAERAESAERTARELASQNALSQARLLVIGQLRDAINRGDGYQTELASARRIALPDMRPGLDRLAATARKGVPRRETLLIRFPALAEDILHADVTDANGSFWQKAIFKAASIVSIRRTDGRGDNTEAIVARSEALVRSGDLAAALDDLAALAERPAAVARPWMDAVSARLAAETTLSELTALAAAETAAPQSAAAP